MSKVINLKTLGNPSFFSILIVFSNVKNLGPNFFGFQKSLFLVLHFVIVNPLPTRAKYTQQLSWPFSTTGVHFFRQLERPDFWWFHMWEDIYYVLGCWVTSHRMYLTVYYSSSPNGLWVNSPWGPFSKIKLVGQKYWDKTTLDSKTQFSCHCFGFQSWCFLLLVGYNI